MSYAELLSSVGEFDLAVFLPYNFTCVDVDIQLALSEEKIKSLGLDRAYTKRLFCIVVECFQNLAKHATYLNENGDIHASMLGIKQDGNTVNVSTANLVRNEDVEGIRRKIDAINGASRTTLRELYKITLNDGIRTRRGGSNLGFIDMLRKAGGKFKYSFEPVDRVNSLFLLHIQVVSRM